MAVSAGREGHPFFMHMFGNYFCGAEASVDGSQ